MHVLLDENLPRALADELTRHRVSTVQAEGWSGTTNSELLERANRRFDALVTMDRGLRYQQNLSGLGIRIVVLHAHSNRMAHLRPLIGKILKALDDLPSGKVREVSV